MNLKLHHLQALATVLSISSAAALAVIICTTLSTFTLTHAGMPGDDNTNTDPSSSSSNSGHELISSPTYSQTMDDEIRELMEDFSSHMTSLHENFVQHPLFTHARSRLGEDLKPFSSSKPFSTWGSFGPLAQWSPRYEVINDPKNFRVMIDVPGFHFHEMKVELESGGRVLSVSGTKENNIHKTSNQPTKEKKAAMGEKANDDQGEDNEEKFEFASHTSASFEQKFTLDSSIDSSLMTANLANGVLEVRAPRRHGAWNKKHIPITQFDEDVWSELIAADDSGETKG